MISKADHVIQNVKYTLSKHNYQKQDSAKKQENTNTTSNNPAN